MASGFYSRCGYISISDLLHWEPPTSQADSVGIGENGRTALAGLSYIKSERARYDKGGTNGGVWQWLSLEIGQNVVAKVRPALKKLPQTSYPAKVRQSAEEDLSLFRSEPAKVIVQRPDRVTVERTQTTMASAVTLSSPRRPNIDVITSRIIEDGFRRDEIGNWLVRLSDEENGIELVVAFSSIIAKARRARAERNRRQSETKRPSG